MLVIKFMTALTSLTLSHKRDHKTKNWICNVLINIDMLSFGISSNRIYESFTEMLLKMKHTPFPSLLL